MQPLLNTAHITSNSSLPTLHPLNLLAQVSSRQITGCLKVITPSNSWLLCLDQSRINYVTTTAGAFDRLDGHLRRISQQVPTLLSAVRVQARLLFESKANANESIADYQAICWLVEQQYLQPNQAANLIEALSQEALEAFLEVTQGNYEILEINPLSEAPKYCQLQLRPTVEVCYSRLKQRRNSEVQANPQPGSQPPKLSAIPPGRSSQAARMDARQAITPPATAKTHYTIACIDDSPTVLRAINDFLDDKIFSVVTIDDPVKALMQVMRNKPDLILLDVTMPNLDGYELCSLLRRHPDFKNTPIVMVTSNTGFIDRAKAKLVRASGYLTKPFNQSDLLKMIFKHLT